MKKNIWRFFFANAVLIAEKPFYSIPSLIRRSLKMIRVYRSSKHPLHMLWDILFGQCNPPPPPPRSVRIPSRGSLPQTFEQPAICSHFHDGLHGVSNQYKQRFDIFQTDIAVFKAGLVQPAVLTVIKVDC